MQMYIKNIVRALVVTFGIVLGFFVAFNVFTKDKKGLVAAGFYIALYAVCGITTPKFKDDDRD